MASSDSLGLAPECPKSFTDQNGDTVELPDVAKTIGRQKQDRHILNGNGYRGGGYFNSHADAQKVLDAYQKGQAEVMGGHGADQDGQYTDQGSEYYWLPQQSESRPTRRTHPHLHDQGNEESEYCADESQREYDVTSREELQRENGIVLDAVEA